MILRLLQIVTFLFLVEACQEDGVFQKGSGDNEKKPVSKFISGTLGSSDALNGGSKNSKGTPIKRATYDLAVRPASGAALCTGTIQLDILDNFGIDFPEAKVKCMGLDINIKDMLGKGMGGGMAGGQASSGGSSGGGEVSGTADEGPAMETDGKILRMRKFGDATFSPARPFLIGPVIQNPNDFKGLSEKRSYNVQISKPKKQSGTGKIELKVNEVNATYKPPKMDKEFKSVIKWHLAAEGFDGINKAQGFLFSKFEMYWNTRPISIPKIRIESKISDMMGDIIEGDTGGMIGNIAGSLLGDLAIELDLVKEEDF